MLLLIVSVGCCQTKRLLLIGRNPQCKRQSRPRVFGAFIAAKRGALPGAGAEGISGASLPLTHFFLGDLHLHLPYLLEQLIELLARHRIRGHEQGTHCVHHKRMA
jgi:hypothetical protein